jgi:hypothetical protein
MDDVMEGMVRLIYTDLQEIKRQLSWLREREEERQSIARYRAEQDMLAEATAKLDWLVQRAKG